MKITWLGHSGFRIEIADQVLLIDPWLKGNPAFPQDRESEAVAGATAIFLTHGHSDHAGDAQRVQSLCNAPIYAVHELAHHFRALGARAEGFNCGGTITLGEVKISMVPARHSSSVDLTGGETRYAGTEAGFMIAGEGRVIYVSGDTSIMADMGWMAEYYKPDIGILCAGGHFTMDMDQAAFVSRKFFNFRNVIPCHYQTFGALEQSADALRRGVDPNVKVHTPEVMESLSFDPV